MLIVNVHRAKTEHSMLLKRVEGGESIIIARAGRPVAKLEPYFELKKKRQPGFAEGKMTIKEEFF